MSTIVQLGCLSALQVLGLSLAASISWSCWPMVIYVGLYVPTGLSHTSILDIYKLFELLVCCLKLKTPNFGFVVARGSDSLMPLHRQRREDMVSKLQIICHGGWFQWRWHWEKLEREGSFQGDFSCPSIPCFVLTITFFEHALSTYHTEFLGTSITTNFKKKHVELFGVFF